MKFTMHVLLNQRKSVKSARDPSKGLREVGVMYCISMYQLYVTFVSSVVYYICIYVSVLYYICMYQRCITFVCIGDTLHLFVSMIHYIYLYP